MSLKACVEKLLVLGFREICGCILPGKHTKNNALPLFAFKRECVEWLLVMSFALDGRHELQLWSRYLNPWQITWKRIFFISVCFGKQFIHSKFGFDGHGLHGWLQSHCRKFLARSEYMKLKKAAITTQCAWRSKVARAELRKLKMVINTPCTTKKMQKNILKKERENETNVEELASP